LGGNPSEHTIIAGNKYHLMPTITPELADHIVLSIVYVISLLYPISINITEHLIIQPIQTLITLVMTFTLISIAVSDFIETYGWMEGFKGVFCAIGFWNITSFMYYIQAISWDGIAIGLTRDVWMGAIILMHMIPIKRLSKSNLQQLKRATIYIFILSLVIPVRDSNYYYMPIYTLCIKVGLAACTFIMCEICKGALITRFGDGMWSASMFMIFIYIVYVSQYGIVIALIIVGALAHHICNSETNKEIIRAMISAVQDDMKLDHLDDKLRLDAQTRFAVSGDDDADIIEEEKERVIVSTFDAIETGMKKIASEEEITYDFEETPSPPQSSLVGVLIELNNEDDKKLMDKYKRNSKTE
jgi:hypothetical protein